MLNVFLVCFYYFFNYDVIFKIINKLKVNNNNFKFKDDFKNHIPIKRIKKIKKKKQQHLTLPQTNTSR